MNTTLAQELAETLGSTVAAKVINEFLRVRHQREEKLVAALREMMSGHSMAGADAASKLIAELGHE